MRLFPNPWVGLHPAFPENPAPLPASNITNAPAVGGSVGLLGVAVGSFFKGRPEIGLTAAAYTMAVVGFGVAALNYVEGNTAKKFLDIKGVEVPKRKYVERLGSFDQDNVLLLGAMVGITVAGRRVRPQHMNRFSWYGGAACFGALGSTYVLKFAPWPARSIAAEQALKNLMIAQQHQGEVMAAIDPESKTHWSQMGRQGGQSNSALGPQSSEQTAPSNDQSAESLLAQFAQLTGQSSGNSYSNTGELPPDLQAEKIDEEDPKPHLSSIEDGERVFKPATNYKWTPGSNGLQSLSEHIEHLKRRREEISKEAELFWHTVATKEAEYYETKNNTPLKDERRVALEIMNEVHLNIWLQASILDWMIADSNKNLLQMKAMSEKSHWIPPFPTAAANIKPKLTGKLLAELSDANQETLMILRETPPVDPTNSRLMATDWRTGQPAKDPEAVYKDMTETMEKALLEVENRQKALDALLDETDRRNRN